MAQVALNADKYAEDRLNKFFKGVVPDLDGQCVSLTKWFMQDMSEVPNPQAPRGHARYIGKRLVVERHAVEVPYANRRRGDLVCYEYGQYGHIGVVLSGDRTFEQNVKWPGVPSKIVNGQTVYASRVGSLLESWRHDMHIYRLKTYSEGVPTMKTTSSEATYLERIIQMDHTPSAASIKNATGKELLAYLKDRYNDGDFLANKSIVKNKYPEALERIKQLEEQLANAGGPTTVLAPGKYEVKGV
jgi:hypothetical protein